MTIESAVSDLTTSTNALLTAVNVSKATLDASVATATAQAATSTSNAASVAAVNTTASTQAGLAAASALQAAASAATANTLAATTTLSESLVGMGQSLHYGAVVDLFIDDTSRHSDGGAWRKRCADKSWYKEVSEAATPCTTWLGQRLNETSARFDIPNTPDSNKWQVTGAPTIMAGAGGYYQSDLTTGRYLSVPSNTLNSLTGDIDIIVKANAADWTPSVAQNILLKTGTVTGYGLILRSTGAIGLQWGNGSVLTSIYSTVAPTVADGADLWVRATFDVDNGASGNTATFYTSADGVTWTQLGTPVVTAGVAVIVSNTNPITVSSSSAPLNGKIYYAEVKSGIGGTSVAKFDGSKITANAAQNYYQSTADGKFYQLVSSSGTTEVFRGAKADHPARCAWILESSRLIGYDPDTGAMWMVFASGGAWTSWTNNAWNAIGTTTLLRLTGLHGLLCVTTSGSGFFRIDLVADRPYLNGGSASVISKIYGGNIAQRHSQLGYVASSPITQYVAGNVCNAVAITALDNAPIDPATGLPTPTVAVGTNNGVSVIHNNGTVVNSSSTGSVDQVFITRDKRLVFGGSAFSRALETTYIGSLAASFSNSTLYAPGTALSWPVAVAINNYCGNDVLGSACISGIRLIKENPSNPAIGMGAFITATYNTGWQIGDSRGTFLADSTAETIAASGELVVTPDLSSSTGWTVGGSWSIGSGVATNTPGSATNLSQVVTTVVGKQYVLGWTSTRSAGTLTVQAVGATVATQTAGATTTVSFTATATTTTISFNADTSFAGTVDNVTVKLASADRSIKNLGLIVNGSIDKSAVATSASTMGYGSSAGTGSSFSTANYLEQPYSANMDFGTGDFAVQFWLKMGTNSAIEYVLNRDSGTPGKAIRAFVDTSGYMNFQLYDGTTTRTATGTLAINDSTWRKWSLSYSAVTGTLNVFCNNLLYATATGTPLLTLTNTSATFRVGCDVAATLPLIHGMLTLLRVSATVKSTDQAAQIYRDELPLFQAGAIGTLYGASAAVTALTYDPVTDTYVAGTTAGTSTFRGLCRVSSNAIGTLGGSTVTALASIGGSVVSGGSAGSYCYQPTLLIRDELKRKDEARRALGKVPQVFDYDTISFTATPTSGSPTLTASSVVGTPYVGMGITGTGIAAGATLIAIVGSTYTMSANATSSPGAVTVAQSGFDLPKGFTTIEVCAAGALKRVGASKDFVTANDGYKETINFGTSPGSAAWVNVLATRNN